MEKLHDPEFTMGTDGFITTNDVFSAVELIRSCGLEARKVGVLEKTDRTGVELTGILNSKKNNLCYSGTK